MQIVTKRGEVEIYRQVLEDSKTLNATVGMLMQQPAGDKIITTVTNNGHDMTFKTDTFDRDRIVRAVNGIVARQKTGANNMPFDFSQAAGMGTDTIDRAVLGPPFLNIIQKGSPEFDETHRQYPEKRIDGCRPGQVVLESERCIVPQPIQVIPLASHTHYVEWKPNKGGFAGHRPLDIIEDRNYRKGAPGSKDQYREYLGQNELVYTILFIVLFKHDETWKRGMIAFTSKQLKKARGWSKAIIGLKLPNNPGVQAPIFAAKYSLSTSPESNDSGGWFGWNVSAPSLLNTETDQALLEQAFEFSKKAQLELPQTQAQPALAAPAELVPAGESPY